MTQPLFVMVREATATDRARLKASAVRFCERRGIPFATQADAVDAASDAGAYFADGGTAPRRPSAFYHWRACARRALRHNKADAIEWGSVGYWVEQ